MTDKILTRSENGIGHLIFNNPERHNAVSLDMWEAAEAVVADFKVGPQNPRYGGVGRRRKSLRVGRGHLQVRERPVQQGKPSNATPTIVDRAYTPPSPNFQSRAIAMIRGYCIGGGLAVVAVLRHAHLRPTVRSLECRLRSSAWVTISKVSSKLVDVVGPAFAKEIFFTARQFSSAEKHSSMGLINRVSPGSEDLEKYVARLHRRSLAANASADGQISSSIASAKP